jgi:ribosomal protein S18 acetylase RimI-like enzyme
MHAADGSRGRGPISLRLAGPEDAPAVAHVHRESRSWYYQVPPDPRDGRESLWQSLLSDPRQTTYVALEQGGTLVGFVSSHRPERDGGPVKLDSLYVLPSHFAQGIGSALYRKFDACERRGGPALLEVWSLNSRAIAFYVRRGWVETSTERPGPQEQPFVTYRLAAT